MGEDKLEQPGPDEARRVAKDGEDTEGHKKRVMSVTDDPGVGPDEHRRMTNAIPDSDGDTEGHKK